jgi:hypothetical protein
VRGDYARLDAVFARALAKRPEDRPRSCGAFASELALAAQRLRDAPTRVGLAGQAALPVFVLASDGVRRLVVRELTGAFERVETLPSIHFFEEAAELVDALSAAERALVLVDGDAASGRGLELGAELRSAGAAAGRPVEVVVLTRGTLAPPPSGSPSAPPPSRSQGVQSVPKPISARALSAALDRACERLVRKEA